MVANGTNALSERARGARPVVLLVEDEQTIAEPFAHALSRNGFEPVIAATGQEALAMERDERPDIVLLDLALPDIDGRDVCRQMREASAVPIIIVTARGTVTDRIVGLELGADDYIVKPFATGEAISRIKAVLRRSGGGRGGEGRGEETGVDGTLQPVAIGELAIDPAARRVTLRGEELSLTRKELDLLLRLAQDAGRVVRRETLMADVWDENWFGSTKTLDVHVASLRRKLGDDSERPQWIHTVRGVGFRFADRAGEEAKEDRR